MGDWDFYVYFGVSVPFFLYVFPFKLSLSTIVAGAALVYFLFKHSGITDKVRTGCNKSLSRLECFAKSRPSIWCVLSLLRLKVPGEA